MNGQMWVSWLAKQSRCMKQLSGVNIQYMCMNGMRADTVLQCFLLFPPFCFLLLFPIGLPLLSFPIVCVYARGWVCVSMCMCKSLCMLGVAASSPTSLSNCTPEAYLLTWPNWTTVSSTGSKMFHLSCRTCGYGQLSVLCFVYFELLVTHLYCVLLPALVHHTSPASPAIQFSLQLQTANQGHLSFSSVSSLTTINQTQMKP